MYYLLSFFTIVLLEAAIYLYGSKFLNLFIDKNKSGNKTLHEGSKIFLGLFVLGNLIFVINLFTPITPYMLIPLTFFIFIFERKQIKHFFSNNFILFSSSSILMFSIYTNNPSTDSLKYHFFNQSLINNSKFVIGISNFDMNYGILSIFEYLSSILWVDNNYFFIQFLNIILLSGFFNFIYLLFDSGNIKFTNISLILLLVGLLDNFGFGGGRNGFVFIQEIGKFDSSVAILLTISFIYLIYILDNKLNFQHPEVLIFLYLSTFLIQVRSFYYSYLGIVLIYFLFNKTLKVTNKLIPLFIVNMLWIVKSIFSNSCLIFPVQFTCFTSLPWSFPYQAKFYSLVATTNNRNPNEHIIEVMNFDWVMSYWLKLNYSYLLNVLITSFLIYVIFRFSKNSKSEKVNYLYWIILFVNILTWFVLYPNYRFISGSLIILYLIVVNKYLNENNFLTRTINSKAKFIVLLFFCISLTPRISTYLTVLENLNINVIERFEITNIEYIDNTESYGVKPVGLFCYNKFDCSISKQVVELKTLYSYKIFIPKNLDMYIKGSINYYEKNY